MSLGNGIFNVLNALRTSESLGGGGGGGSHSWGGKTLFISQRFVLSFFTSFINFLRHIFIKVDSRLPGVVFPALAYWHPWMVLSNVFIKSLKVSSLFLMKFMKLLMSVKKGVHYLLFSFERINYFSFTQFTKLTGETIGTNTRVIAVPVLDTKSFIHTRLVGNAGICNIVQKKTMNTNLDQNIKIWYFSPKPIWYPLHKTLNQ